MVELTPRARNALTLAQKEAQHLKNNYIGTEHILLGLLGEDKGTAAKILRKFGVTLEKVRKEVGC